MLNSIILVGRLTSNVEVQELEDGRSVSSVILAVNRNFKNADGIYETDFIKCILWNVVAINTAEYCKVGDVIGIKGRLQTSSYEDSDHKTKYNTEVVAEKVTFLSSKKPEADE